MGALKIRCRFDCCLAGLAVLGRPFRTMSTGVSHPMPQFLLVMRRPGELGISKTRRLGGKILMAHRTKNVSEDRFTRINMKQDLKEFSLIPRRANAWEWPATSAVFR